MQAIETLTDEEIGHLQNITFGGLMRTVIPSHIEEKLLLHGYARRAVGGLMPTDHGHHAIIDWDGK